MTQKDYNDTLVKITRAIQRGSLAAHQINSTGAYIYVEATRDDIRDWYAKHFPGGIERLTRSASTYLTARQKQRRNTGMRTGHLDRYERRVGFLVITEHREHQHGPFRADTLQLDAHNRLKWHCSRCAYPLKVTEARNMGLPLTVPGRAAA